MDPYLYLFYIYHTRKQTPFSLKLRNIDPPTKPKPMTDTSGVFNRRHYSIY